MAVLFYAHALLFFLRQYPNNTLGISIPYTRQETTDNFLSAVLKIYLLFFYRGIANQFFCFQIFFMHINGTDLMIIIRRVIINPFIGISAGGVDRDFIFSFGNFAAASALFHGT